MHHDPLLGRIVRRFLDLWAERRALEHLSDAQLADIGLTRNSAEAESRRPPWDVPDGRRFDPDRTMHGRPHHRHDIFDGQLTPLR